MKWRQKEIEPIASAGIELHSSENKVSQSFIQPVENSAKKLCSTFSDETFYATLKTLLDLFLPNQYC